MKHTTTCYICGEIWKPKKWEHFMDFCSHCQMKWMVGFEMQFQRILSQCRKLRVENT